MDPRPLPPSLTIPDRRRPRSREEYRSKQNILSIKKPRERMETKPGTASRVCDHNKLDVPLVQCSLIAQFKTHI